MCIIFEKNEKNERNNLMCKKIINLGGQRCYNYVYKKN